MALPPVITVTERSSNKNVEITLEGLETIAITNHDDPTPIINLYNLLEFYRSGNSLDGGTGVSVDFTMYSKEDNKTLFITGNPIDVINAMSALRLISEDNAETLLFTLGQKTLQLVTEIVSRASQSVKDGLRLGVEMLDAECQRVAPMPAA